jgi:hypothetical protein
MSESMKKLFGWRPTRDSNYYFGLFLLEAGIVSIFFYLKFDAFEPLSFLITFLVVGWGFILLWKSDNDYRFRESQATINQLREEVTLLRKMV